MRILVGVAHPKHVYMFKNFIKEMEMRGHFIKILAIEKEITEYLLQQSGLSYIPIGNNPPQIYKKMLNVPKWEYFTLKIAREFKPDIFIGQALPHFAHVSAIFGKPYIILEDTEIAHLVQSISFPFADRIITPNCYMDDLGGKQIRFDGYFELAYLHPNYFTPNPAVLTELGLKEGDKFIIIRFVSWGASHDLGQYGIKNKLELMKELEEYGRVMITSEGQLPEELEVYKIRVSPDKLHDLLYYASLYVGEGGTTAAEAAVLGTPSIFVSTLVGTMGNFIELEEKYGLLYGFTPESPKLRSAIIEILKNQASKENWRIKRLRLLEDKVDITAFMVWFIENYPESAAKTNNDSQIRGVII